MSKVALITVITSQDGSYLAEFLLENGYDVATGKMLVCVNPQWFRSTASWLSVKTR